jgi:tetratricopeptide (TPR) repeat protein
MPETIREYAREELQRHGESAALQQRHLHHFLPWVEEACLHLYRAEQLEWMARFDRDADNLRAALEWCVQRGRSGDQRATEQGLRLAGALGWYWFLHSRHTEGLAWLERLLSLPAATARTVGRARALVRAAHLSLTTGWFPRGGPTPAWALGEEALAIGRELGDRESCATACLILGYLLPDRAAQRARREEGLRLYRELDDAWGVSLALWVLGQAQAQRGDLAAAEALCDESLAVGAAVGDRLNSACAQVILAQVAVARADAASARALLEQALRLDRELGDRRNSGITLAHLGDVALSIDDRGAARDCYCEALPIFLESGDSGMSALVLTGLASLALAGGAPAQAVRLAGAAASITRSAPWVAAERWANWQHRLSTLQIREAAGQTLGQQESAQAWAEGQAMTLEQAIAYALEQAGGG